MRNNFYDENNRLKGYIEDGVCYDDYKCRVCYLLPSGEFVTSRSYRTIMYRIHNNGVITEGTTNRICGYIDAKGCVTATIGDGWNRILGHFDHYPLNTLPSESSYNIDTPSNSTGGGGGYSAGSVSGAGSSSDNYGYSSAFAPEWVNTFNLFMFMAILFVSLFNLPTGIIGILYTIIEVIEGD